MIFGALGISLKMKVHRGDDVADSSEEIEARGKLESVNEQYSRLVIGTTTLKIED